MNIPQEFEDVFRGVELTEDEIRTLTWIAGWESRTVENLCSAIRKVRHRNGKTLGRAFADQEDVLDNAATALSALQAENEKLRAELEQVKRCIEIVENQRDSAIKELENYMVQDVLDGNEPCAICAKASDTPCEYCNPKWRGQKED